MLGQPVYFLTPDVVGFEFTGQLREGVTATDLVLDGDRDPAASEKVVGKFVEFFGEGTSQPRTARPRHHRPTWRRNTARPWASSRSTRKTIEYFEGTGRTPERDRVRSKPTSGPRACSGAPRAGSGGFTPADRVDSTSGSVAPSPGRSEAAAGPDRPRQGQVEKFTALYSEAAPSEATASTSRPPSCTPGIMVRGAEDAARKTPCNAPTHADGQARRADDFVVEMAGNKPTLARSGCTRRKRRRCSQAVGDTSLGNGDVLIAAITSCTNTSNPSVLLAAGLLAKKAVEAGLRVQSHIKTSLAPGSRIVTEYLHQGRPAGLPRASLASASRPTAARPASATPAT